MLTIAVRDQDDQVIGMATISSKTTDGEYVWFVYFDDVRQYSGAARSEYRAFAEMNAAINRKPRWWVYQKSASLRLKYYSHVALLFVKAWHRTNAEMFVLEDRPTDKVPT